jgi:hypothetical protein
LFSEGNLEDSLVVKVSQGVNSNFLGFNITLPLYQSLPLPALT